MLMAAAGRGGLDVADVFSTDLYTGNGSTQSIVNGIDLDGEGGLTWIKSRSGTFSTQSHNLFDTLRGAGYKLDSGSTAAQAGAGTTRLTAFNSNGFSLDSDSDVNGSSTNYASWTFRIAPKFFDVVTYTGTGEVGQTVNHNLGAVPGMIIIKGISAPGSWYVWHRSLGANEHLKFNTTAAVSTDSNYENCQNVTDTTFDVDTGSEVDTSGQTYVAYLFAHDDSASGIIQCGSYEGNGSSTGPVIDLGWEPQWVMVKRSDSTANWILADNERGFPVGGATPILYPNVSDAEATATTAFETSSTGFQVKTAGTTFNASGGTYVYLAVKAES
jgi:hypothetical protein